MNIRTITVVICLLSVCSITYGQRIYRRSYNQESEPVKRMLQRDAIGYIQPFQALNLTLHYSENTLNIVSNGNTYPNPNGVVANKTLVDEIKNKSSWGVYFGYTFPVAKFDNSNALAIDMPVTVVYCKWPVATKTFTAEETIEGDASSLQIGVGMGLKYVYGGEVALDRNKKTLFSLGAGIMPTLAAVQYSISAGATSMRPYFMAEAGVFAGIGFKVRATILPGTFTYINQDKYLGTYNWSGNPDQEKNLHIQMEGKTGIELSVMLMPNSYHWVEGGSNPKKIREKRQKRHRSHRKYNPYRY